MRLLVSERHTCLHDLGFLLGNGGVLAHSTLVLRKHSELVGVAHDEVRDGGVQSMVMFQHSEPVLGRHRRTGSAAWLSDECIHFKINSLQSFCLPSELRNLWSLYFHCHLEQSTPEQHWNPRCPRSSHWQEAPAVLWRRHPFRMCDVCEASIVMFLMKSRLFVHQRSEGRAWPCPQSPPPSRTSHTFRSLLSQTNGWTRCCLSRCCGC